MVDANSSIDPFGRSAYKKSIEIIKKNTLEIHNQENMTWNYMNIQVVCDCDKLNIINV